MRCFFISLTLVLFTGTTNAQNAEDSVKAVVNKLFWAMKNADAAVFKTAFADSAIMQTISRNKQGQSFVRTESVAEFAALVGGLKKDSADERIKFETVKIDGPLAIVWTPYQFFHNGKFSHCGVNSFHLVKLQGVWKIQYLIDTRRREGCL
jgi:Putative lumazine-binding